MIDYLCSYSRVEVPSGITDILCVNSLWLGVSYSLENVDISDLQLLGTRNNTNSSCDSQNYLQTLPHDHKSKSTHDKEQLRCLADVSIQSQTKNQYTARYSEFRNKERGTGKTAPSQNCKCVCSTPSLSPDTTHVRQSQNRHRG